MEAYLAGTGARVQKSWALEKLAQEVYHFGIATRYGLLIDLNDPRALIP